MAKPTAAIIGASANRSKFGNKSVRAHLAAGYEVFPINPSADEIEGLKCYRSITDVPGEIDLASVYLPPPLVVDELDAIARRKPKTVWLNPGTESQGAIDRATELELHVVCGCSIVALGLSPSQFP
jgi:hypothetical protein